MAGSKLNAHAKAPLMEELEGGLGLYEGFVSTVTYDASDYKHKDLYGAEGDVRVIRMVENAVLYIILGATLEMWYSEFNCSILISMRPSRLSVLVTWMEAVKFRKPLIQDLQEEILKGRPDNLSCVLLHDSFQLAFVPHNLRAGQALVTLQLTAHWMNFANGYEVHQRRIPVYAISTSS
ncbi:hypothetical protein C2845_PM04G22450 [Panicum miliaceum]|uniref:Uncharacterized protein n=1 Tax=Panicum miliaceum TaxID=4540 RepID=A0A3L6QRS5_PANMI|nr:hypothetical protein C2845_PM04G22450 [Panicum miliaceum]